MKAKKQRLKPLLPTLKEKKRYLAFEIVSKAKNLAFKDVSRAIWDAALGFAGTLGGAKMGLQVFPEKYDAKTQRGLIRVAHNQLEELKASLAFITHVNNTQAIARSIGASGILAKAEEKYLGGQYNGKR